ncbi:hypothetical protein AWC38_SpisGene10066 [Stylophora pistillata]|uniref:Uncharacterized protein n=1 Tax=Stylophora pistillata TaxID=50429 RepID=A0A2B4S878_STYPI|nr:hypothetical protein AWC38_SpisGene10066 [Stylophora pistillata]
MGHCLSYDEVQAVDTSLAMEVTALVEQMGTIIPSNISPGPFIQIAADNNDINQEILDGKNTTHATTIVVYQRKQYGPQPPSTSHGDQTRRRRSLHSPGPLYEVQDYSMHGRLRPVVKDFLGVDDREWFSGKSEDLTSTTVDDTIWAILRIELSLLLKTTVLEGANRQLVPSWSAFNAILYPDIPCSNNIGYCPLIDAPSKEFSTVYTVMNHAQQISERVGQLEAVITFDLAIYDPPVQTARKLDFLVFQQRSIRGSNGYTRYEESREITSPLRIPQRASYPTGEKKARSSLDLSAVPNPLSTTSQDINKDPDPSSETWQDMGAIPGTSSETVGSEMIASENVSDVSDNQGWVVQRWIMITLG